MIFWLLAAVMTVVALALILLPLLRRRHAAAPRVSHDLAIYRDQLSELESDAARGLIGPEEAAAAKLEIQRRMLSASKDQEARPEAAALRFGRPQWVAAIALLISIPALAVGLYLTMGSPGLPAQPFAARDDVGGPAALAGMDIDAAIGGLETRLAENPEDLEGWLMLGRTYMTLERYPEAIRALRRAVALAGDEPSVMAMLGEAIVLSEGGMINPEAAALFESVLARSPNDPAARYYIGLAFAQGGNVRQALDTWMDLAASTPIDAPWRPHIVGAIQRAAAELEIELAEIPAAPAMGAAQPPMADAEPGPSAEDMAAAQDMSPEDRMDMIRSMVERLAARLDENPDDPAGWERLIRAYRVLGEDEKAAAAEARLAELGAPVADDQPGPDAEDFAAAEEMSAEDRSAMIRSMVERLAERLEESPDDVEGWQRLGQSWRVLGEWVKARDAYGRAVELSPEDPALLGEYGRSIMEADPDATEIPAEAVAIFRRALALDTEHMEALWFIGYAEAQAGNVDAARESWSRLLPLLAPGTPDHNAVQQALDSL